MTARSTYPVKQGMLMFPILAALQAHRDSPEGKDEEGHPKGVKITTLMTTVLTSLGYTLDCNGQKADGSPKVSNQFNNAGMELRNRDLILSIGRDWSITAAGTEALRTRTLPAKNKERWESVRHPRKSSTSKLQASSESSEDAEGDPEDDFPPPIQESGLGLETAEVAPKGAPVPEIWNPYVEAGWSPSPEPSDQIVREAAELSAESAADRIVSFEKRRAALAGESWVEDPAIRAIVAANTACYGTYSPMATACGKCPLKKHCARALAESMRAIASALDQAAVDRETEEVEKNRTSLETAIRNVPDVLNARTPKVVVSDVIRRKLVTTFDGNLCARTGMAIPRGTEALYIQGIGLVSLSAAQPDELSEAESVVS